LNASAFQAPEREVKHSILMGEIRRFPTASWTFKLSRHESPPLLSDNPRIPVHLLADRATGREITVNNFPLLSADEQEIFWGSIDALFRQDHRSIVHFFGFVLQFRRMVPELRRTS
jgi:hypothetical protein